MDQEGFVIAAVKGKEIMPLGYFDGEDGWTIHDNARVYYSRPAVRSGLFKAKQVMPADATILEVFPVYVGTA